MRSRLSGLWRSQCSSLAKPHSRRVDAAAPLDGFEIRCVRGGGDLGGLLPGAMVAPEVVIVERLEVGVDRDDAGAGGVERDGLDGVAVDAGVVDAPCAWREPSAFMWSAWLCVA